MSPYRIVKSADFNSQAFPATYYVTRISPNIIYQLLPTCPCEDCQSVQKFPFDNYWLAYAKMLQLNEKGKRK